VSDSRDPFRSVLEAVAFATRAHRHQVRKDGQTPYISHPFRVCLVVRHVFGFDDPRILTAALLHDTIEDTTTDLDDLLERFGPEVAGWVAVLTKDKRLPDDAREETYMRGLAAADWPVKVCKLADIYDNMSDSVHLSERFRRRTLGRTQRYLAAIGRDLPEQARRPFEMVSDLVREVEATLPSPAPDSE
jgi:guanosine-3',5'-bis(diphosphate) 3'-pyrophosphohydrolase